MGGLIFPGAIDHEASGLVGGETGGLLSDGEAHH